MFGRPAFKNRADQRGICILTKIKTSPRTIGAKRKLRLFKNQLLNKQLIINTVENKMQTTNINSRNDRSLVQYVEIRESCRGYDQNVWFNPITDDIDEVIGFEVSEDVHANRW